MKVYDEAYFRRWYRSSRAVVSPAVRERKVRLAVAATEYILGREIETVLDVGCGEAPWRSELRSLRPGLEYTGVDSSEYVLRRFGTRRNIIEGTFGTVGRLGLKGKYDLIVCADVLHYVPTPELRRGLVSIRRLLRGVAYLEAFATSDAVVGDLQDWHHRSEATYRREFADAGFIACGLNCWIPAARRNLLGAMERCG